MKTRYLDSGKKSIGLLILMAACYALIYMTKNCYTAAMASIVSAGIMTKSQTGLISAVFYLVYAPFQIVGGVAADKLSPKWLITLGVIGAGICNGLIYFVNGYVAMIIIWGLNALVQFGVWPSIFKIITTELMPNHRTVGILCVNLSISVGLGISYLFATFIVDWKDNFLYSAIILFLIAAAFFIFYSGFESKMSEHELPDRKEKENKRKKGTFSLILKSGVPLLLVISFSANMITYCIKGLMPVMLVECYENVTPSFANALNILLVIASPIGLLISSLPIFKRLNVPSVIAIFSALCIPFFVLVLWVGNINLYLIVGSLTVICIISSALTLQFSYISKTFAVFGCVGTLSGLFNCAASFGIMAWNFIFTRVADAYGWGTTAKLWLFVMMAAFIICLISIPIWKNFLKRIKA